MKRLLLLMWAVFATGAGKDAKVEVCHLPPGDPGNYHTLTIPASALKAHLGHGDLTGSCGNYCGLFCNTGNKCAQDNGTFDSATGRCICSSQQVDCSATSPCLTVAGCDPAEGCAYTVNVGAACNADNNVCTGPDACDAAGVCQAGPPVPNCCLAATDCIGTDLCVQHTCNTVTNQCEQTATTTCNPTTACDIGACDSNTGSCQFAPIACTSTPGTCACWDQCVNTASDPNNCGGCGQVCNSNNMLAACSSGVCSGTCSAGFADCNLDKLADGCEVDLMTDLANCGACGTACGGGSTCVAGVCTGLCTGGRCSGTTTQACAYDKNCPTGETCEWTQSFARFVDNGDGTVTDGRTCLMWEKKTGTVGTYIFCEPGMNCDPHEVNNRYNWSLDTQAPWDLDGFVVTEFLAKLNGGAGFAGYTDWRLPTSAGTSDYPTGQDPELESILLTPYPCATSPCIEPVFGPTGPWSYWSSSVLSPWNPPRYAWQVFFDSGLVGTQDKGYIGFARAVRP